MELGTVYQLSEARSCGEEWVRFWLAPMPILIDRCREYAEKAFKECVVKTKVLSMATSGKQIKVIRRPTVRRSRALRPRPRSPLGRVPIICGYSGWNTKITGRTQCFNSRSTRSARRTTRRCNAQLATLEVACCCAHRQARVRGKVAVDAIPGEFETLDKIHRPAVVFTVLNRLVRVD